VISLLVLAAKLVLSKFVKTNFKIYGSKDNAWAVVTGASDGIGKEFSIQLAQKGFNIILISRSEEKLKVVAEEIAKTGRETKVIPFNFSTAIQGDYESLISELKNTKFAFY